MKTEDLLIISALALVGFMAYKVFSASSGARTQRAVTSLYPGGISYDPTFREASETYQNFPNYALNGA